MPPTLQQLELPAELAPALATGHPWIYRDHLPRGFAAKTGCWLRVRSGSFEGYALWEADAPLALRIYSRRQVPDAAWVEARVREAWELRRPLREGGTDAYRWVFGEGDGLPGLSVDLYARYAVVTTYAESVAVLLPDLVRALTRVTRLSGVLRRSKSPSGEVELDALWGELPPQRISIVERGARLAVELYDGQKTGLFLDHRENRYYLRERSQGLSVLNLFAYTGAFSVHCLLGGATRVTSVDAAAPAIAAARHNLSLNGFEPSDHEFVVEDVYAYLERAREAGKSWDLVISDPPSFARSKSRREAARRAYVRLNALALAVTRPGGWLAAASCTAQMSPAAFLGTVADAARRAQRRVQVVHDIGQPLDHPHGAQHPEGRYLKFIVGRVHELV